MVEFRKTAKRRSVKTAKEVRLSALQRTRKLQEMLDREPGLTRAELARRLGISRARMTQILARASVPGETWKAPEPSTSSMRSV